MKTDLTSVEIHPQPSHNAHPVDGSLVGASSLWSLGSPEPFFFNLCEEQGKLGLQHILYTIYSALGH